MEQPLSAERHRRIGGLFRARRVARISTLPGLMGVSEVTLERDLEVLAHVEAIGSNPEAKGAIGRAGAALVGAGSGRQLG